MNIRWYDSLDSTNEEARRCAARGEGGPLWIVARRQTKGRGRRGRRWVSFEGNLMVTVFLRGVSCMTKLAFLAPVAMLRSCADFLEEESKALSVKWPNDLLFHGKKMGGVLLESDMKQGRPLWVGVGMGINLVRSPSETLMPATAFQVWQRPPSVEALLLRLIYHFESLRKRTRREILELWRCSAARMGQEMIVRLRGEVMRGVGEAIDAEGALCLRLSGGELRRIHMGDVFFGEDF